ncbi:MAG: MATE family efflux transporter [Lentisphaeria bacterium]|nr:MATE family efflux transporter [Lentisphaeria bacterium]
MTHGPLFSRIVLFALPLMATGMLQLLFHATNMMVLGKFSSQQSLGAVGATASLCGLLINTSLGLAIGANVLIANYIGSREWKKVSRTTHTALLLSLIVGGIVAVTGVLLSRQLLIWTKAPDDVIDLACIYMQIYFAAVPLNVVYNFGAAIMRGAGDTRRPLYYLLAAGAVNMLLSLLFVIVFKWDGAGVAIASGIGNLLAMVLVLRALHRAKEAWRLRFKHLRLDFPILKRMLWIGLPAGLQSSCFSISNVIIQSSVNSLGTAVLAGNTAGMTLEGIVYLASYAFHQTALSFVGQNFGAGKYVRLKRSVIYCALFSFLIVSLFAWIVVLFQKPLLMLFMDKDEVNPVALESGCTRITIMLSVYGICAAMDVFSGALRGMGYSIQSACITVFCVCVIRVGWVFWVFPHYRTLENLIWSYPITWTMNTIASGALFAVLYHINRKRHTKAALS